MGFARRRRATIARMVDRPADDADEWVRTTELVARSQAGDQAAFAALMGRFTPRLSGFLHSRLPPARRALTDTDDALQEIRLKVWQALPRFEPRGIGSFWWFMRQVARNRVTDEWRKAARRSEVTAATGAAKGVAPEPIDPAATPQGAAISVEEQELFEEALATVPEQARCAVVLRLELGLDYGGIARDVGYPSPDAARVAIRRALVKVATEIAARG